jgi:hypothetical protein
MGNSDVGEARAEELVEGNGVDTGDISKKITLRYMRDVHTTSFCKTSRYNFVRKI